MFNALFEISIGIITSVIIGTTILIFQKLRKLKKFNRKANFFKIKTRSECYITMNYARDTNAMSHNDVYTLAELLKVVHELKGEIFIAPVNDAKRAPGEGTEFCIGGPDSNERTKKHIESYLKGVKVKSYKDDESPLEIRIRDKSFKYQKSEKEFVILSKIIPANYGYPIFLISGQTSITNRGAAYYLVQNYNSIIQKYDIYNQFCYILYINNPQIYGYKTIELVEDLTEFAFKE